MSSGKGIIINSQHHEHAKSIVLETSKATRIANEQYTIATAQEMRNEESYERTYDSKFQGEPSKIYNCHGLTFACRRTGIYDDKMLNTILIEEYIEIRILKNILVGDVVVYYNGNDITHSAMVVKVDNRPENLIPVIMVLSKTRAYKEIVHNVNNSPYGAEKRFFRINHGQPSIV